MSDKSNVNNKIPQDKSNNHEKPWTKSPIQVLDGNNKTTETAPSVVLEKTDTQVTLMQPHKTKGEDENGKILLKMDYRMTAAQNYVALCLLDKKSELFRTCNAILMGIIALFGFSLGFLTKNGSYFLLGFLCIIFIYALLIAPQQRRIKTALATATNGGCFETTIYKKGSILFRGNEKPYVLRLDAKARSYETDDLIVFDLSQKRNVCLPKTCLTSEEYKAIKAMCEKHTHYMEITKAIKIPAILKDSK